MKEQIKNLTFTYGSKTDESGLPLIAEIKIEITEGDFLLKLNQFLLSCTIPESMNCNHPCKTTN